MRSVVVLLLSIAAFVPAQSRFMHIHQIDNTADTIFCNQIDAERGVVFDRTWMNVSVVDTVNGAPRTSIRTFCTSRIDSITFDFIGGLPYVFTACPAAGQVFHVGETITLQWKLNPLVAGELAFLDMSTDGGTTWKKLTQKECSMMYRDSGYSGEDSLCAGVPVPHWQWPYVRTNDGQLGTVQIAIANPMLSPAEAELNPVSESVIIRIVDYALDGKIEHATTPVFAIVP